MNVRLSQLPSQRSVVVAIGLAAFLCCYGTVIVSLFTIWTTNPLYSHGVAVPFIAGLMWWTRRDQVAPSDSVPDYAFGIPLVFLGTVMLVVGHIGALITIQQTSVVVTFSGLLLIALGRRSFKTHWVAITYLMLMIPVWSFPLEQLQQPSRVVSANIAAVMLHGTGVPVALHHTSLVLPSHTLSVMRECSGVNQFVALAAMVIPAAYLWLATSSHRAALIVIAVLVTYLSNGLRIAVVGWLAFSGLGDGRLLDSSTHILQGLVVSAFAYLMIGVCLAFLMRSEKHSPKPAARAALRSMRVMRSGRRPLLDSLAIIIVLFGTAAQLVAGSREVSVRGSLEALPNEIGDWALDERRGDAEPLGVPDALLDSYPTASGQRQFDAVDDELVRVYVNSSGNRLHLYVGHYRRQQEGRELTGVLGHELQMARTTVRVLTESGLVTLSEVAQTKDPARKGILFWYDVNGRISSNVYQAKIYSVWDGLIRWRTNGTVVMIGWQQESDVNATGAREQAIDFARLLIPILHEHLPS